MRRLLVCAALVWLAAASSASGQESGVTPTRAGAPSFARREDAAAEAARLLRSRENRERAWGAYLAGAYGLKEHAALVVELLEDPNAASGGWEESAVRRTALDALIRLDADVPAEKLLALYPEAPDEVVILLARLPERNAAALLSLFEEETPDVHWIAVGNLLTAARAKGFAARLLARLKMQATVYVYDREAERGYGGGHGGGCGGSRRFGRMPDGFPPASRYGLTTVPLRGAVVAAHGRNPVYYVRADSWDTYVPDPACEIVPRDGYRVEYLADLLRTTGENLGLEALAFHEVVCRDARQCRRALAALRDETARTYAAVLERLLGEELLDPAEASELKPDLTLKLYDERDGKTSPLPDRLDGVKIILVGVASESSDAALPEARQ